MPQHRIDMRFPSRPVDIGNGDVSLSIYSDSTKLGELGLSKGSITWWPRDAKTPVDISWERFARLMQDQA